MNIANFMTWFLQQFVRVGTYMIGKLDEIKLIGQVSLLDFTITIAIIGIFITIILTLPQNMNTKSKYVERKMKK